MIRRRVRLLATLGTALIFAGCGMLLLEGNIAQAQVEEWNYIGTEECSSCHRSTTSAHRETGHGLALQATGRDKAAILADFSLAADVRTVTFPNEEAPRAFTAEDIAYVIGDGHGTQAYVYEDPEEVLSVLPAQWNIDTNTWQPYILANTWPEPAYDFTQNCAYCHTTALDVEDGRWDEEGVQCESCHGPGSEHAYLADDAGSRASDDELAGIRAAINPAIDPQVCGQCHARGSSSDAHPYPVGYLPGMNLSDVFTPFPPAEGTQWYPTGHAQHINMQYNEWINDGHAQSLTSLLDSGAAIDGSCLTCHSADYAWTERLIADVRAGDREGDPLDSLTAETARFGVTCASCHNPHESGEQPANLVEEPYALCVSCHSNSNFEGEGLHHPVQEMFEGIQIIPEVVARPSDHFTSAQGPTCTTCHFPSVPVDGSTRASHTLNPIMPGAALDVEGLTDTCSECHAEVASPASLQQLIDDIQNNTRERIATARAAVTETTPAWVIQALDFVEGDGSFGIHNYAYSDALLDAVFAELGLFSADNGTTEEQ